MILRKAAVLCLTMLVSAWFVPVNFLVGTYFGIGATCVVQRCAWNRDSGDPHPSQFYVMVRDGGGDVVSSVLLKDLDSYMSRNPHGSLRLNNLRGSSKYGDWQYTVISEAAGYQVIEARYQDAASISESYRVTGGVVQPLTSRIQSASYLFTSIPVGVLFACMIRRMARRRILADKRDSMEGVR